MFSCLFSTFSPCLSSHYSITSVSASFPAIFSFNKPFFFIRTTVATFLSSLLPYFLVIIMAILQMTFNLYQTIHYYHYYYFLFISFKKFKKTETNFFARAKLKRNLHVRKAIIVFNNNNNGERKQMIGFL